MFTEARIKLTAWYLAIIMTVSFAFSAIIYTGLIHEVERFARGQRAFIQRRMQENLFFQPDDVYFINPDLVADTRHRILLLLGAINGSILLLSGALGYILAGRTLKPIQIMVDEQNRFISDASHELKTPLTSLKSAFEVHLRNKKRSQNESDTLVRESIDEVNKLQSLTESLLLLVSFQQPKKKNAYETVALAPILARAAKQIHPLAKKKRIAIRIEPTDMLIHANANSLIELLVILLDNAVKYSKARQKVVVRATSEDHSVAIAVSDQGIGIGPQQVPHIFERFYRSDTARTKTGANGYGLGLAIAKKIAEAHNGSIHVDSTPKKGSTFTVVLPKHFSKRSDS